ncbi:hypothetical protein WJX81_007622 [Elliptochloris bilobata]|uniref:mannan endo-1,4-beta-mannosidase n=1 Tax=Elliptochloris bilobata TaxID=381761 RepID=A0AAW1QZ24_9CHLO
MADSCEYWPVGWNSWRLLEGAMGISGALPADTSVLKGANIVEYLMAHGKQMGFNTFRMFGFGDGAGCMLQPSPGQYNEQAFAATDLVLALAAQHGMKVIVAITDYWKITDGVQQYVNWCNGGNKDDFFTNEGCHQLYRSHTQAWIDKMAEFVKSVDPNHMVTIGEEGFFAAGDPHESRNPSGSGGWASSTGQDFTGNHRSPHIDFCTCHIWPDNWKVGGVDFVTSWLDAHIAAAASLGKPLLVEEFGKVVTADTDACDSSERSPYFEAVYGKVEASIRAGGAAKGAMFWEWTVKGAGETLDVSWPNGTHPMGVCIDSSTFRGPVKNFAAFVASHQTAQGRC